MNLFNCLTCRRTVLVIIIVLILLWIFDPWTFREGVVFTNYDNSKLFTKPWNKFCETFPPSCNFNLPSDSSIIPSPIGCWCDEHGEAPKLNNNCTDLDYSLYPEYRR